MLVTIMRSRANPKISKSRTFKNKSTLAESDALRRSMQRAYRCRTLRAALLLLSLAALWSASVLRSKGKWREAFIMIRIFADAALVATTAASRCVAPAIAAANTSPSTRPVVKSSQDGCSSEWGAALKRSCGYSDVT